MTIRELDCGINDPAFAEAAAGHILAGMGAGTGITAKSSEKNLSF